MYIFIYIVCEGWSQDSLLMCTKTSTLKSGLILENSEVRWTPDDHKYDILSIIHIYIKHVSSKNITLEGMKS